MTSQLWTEKEKRIVAKMLEEEMFYADIAEVLQDKGYDRTTGAVRCLMQRLRKKGTSLGSNKKKKDTGLCKVLFSEEEKLSKEEKQQEQSLAYAAAVEEISKMKREALDICSEKYDELGTPKGKLHKILSLSDFHIPFENEDIIDHALREHGDASVLVINGDFFDQYSVSKWPKNKHYLLRHEYELALKWIKLLSKKFKNIFLLKGNHDKRTESHFMTNIDPGVSFLTHPDMLERLANGYDFDPEMNCLVKKYDFDNVHYTPGACSWYLKIGECLFAHPSGGSKIPMRSVVNTAQYFLEREDFNSVSTVVIGHCFDEDTELLTDQGWKNIDTIQETDRPLTLNTESNLLEFNPCEGIHKYSNHNEVIAFENNVGLEVLVTPEHGMLYSTERNLGTDLGKRWKRANAEEIENYNRFSIPASGILDNKDNKTVDDVTIRLLAWVLTEGNIELTSARNPVIRISQSDDGSGFIHEIEHLIQALRVEYSKSLRYKANSHKHGQHRNYDAYRFYIGTEGSRYLAQYLDLNSKTLNHEFLMSLSLRQRELLIEEMCKGDGSKCGTNHYCHYYTSNKRLLDQFQLLCTLSGIRNKANIRREDGTWVVSMTKTAIHTVISSERREYNGRTWCLTVPNGTLVARRRGVVFITQNTHKLGKLIWKNKLLIEQGCCCAPMEYESDAKLRFGQQTFGYAVVYMNEEGKVDFKKTQPIYYGTGAIVKPDIHASIF